MGFTVSDAAIDSYAGKLARFEGYVPSLTAHGQKYADQVTDNIGDLNALYPPLVAAHRELAPAAIGLIRSVGSALGAAQRELTATATLYRKTDDDHAAKLDATYKKVDRYPSPSGMRPDIPSVERAGEKNPLDRIRGEPRIKNDPTAAITDVLDHVTSLAHNINWVVKTLTGVDLVELLTNTLVGDWKAWSRCADVWNQLGAAMPDIGYEVWEGNVYLDRTWDGRAADAAYAYFHDFAEEISDIRKHLVHAAAQYNYAAGFVQCAASVLGDLVKYLVDQLLIMGIAAFGGPGGMAAAGVLESFQQVRIIKTVSVIVNFVSVIRAGVAAICATLHAITGALHTTRSRITHTYDHPGV